MTIEILQDRFESECDPKENVTGSVKPKCLEGQHKPKNYQCQHGGKNFAEHFRSSMESKQSPTRKIYQKGVSVVSLLTKFNLVMM